MKPIKTILFKREDVDDILKALEIKVKDDQLINEQGQKITCNMCGCPIKKTNLGNIMPGSKIFYCDNPICFTDYVSRTRY